MNLRPVIGRVGIDSWHPCYCWGRPPSRHWGCRVVPVRARCEGNWSPQTSQFSGSFGNGDDSADGEVMGPTPAAGNDRLPNHPTRQRGSAVSGGMVVNRSFEMIVEMLSPSSAGEVCGADAEGTMQWQSCHKEHSMFRVSAPPKPQTPGPSRPALPAPHEGRPG